MSIGNNIYSLRKAKKVTQAQLAEKLGVSEQAVSKWEQGRSCPDIAILDEIADALGISLIELLGMEKRSKNSS